MMEKYIAVVCHRCLVVQKLGLSRLRAFAILREVIMQLIFLTIPSADSVYDVIVNDGAIRSKCLLAPSLYSYLFHRQALTPFSVVSVTAWIVRCILICLRYC